MQHSLMTSAWIATLVGVGTLAPTSSGPSFGSSRIDSLDRVEKLYQSDDLPDSLANFVSRLAEPLYENYVLVHTSQSLQPSSPVSPRVITYNPQTKMILAYSGLRSDDGRLVSNGVEIIQYEESTADFVFAEVDYSGEDPRLQVDPEKCQTCHSRGLHPNWFTYPMWPGAYDARDSSSPASSIEVESFPRFLEAARGDPLYESLRERQTYFERSPSTSFNDFLNPMNRSHIGSELTRLENFEPFKYAVAAALSSRCGSEIESYLPSDLRDAHFTTPHESFKEETVDDMQSAFERRFQYYVDLNDGTIGEYPYYRPSNFLMQGYYRHQVSSLRYMLDQKEPAAHRLFFALNQTSFQTPWASALITARVPGVEYESCADLKEKSLDSLEDWRELGEPRPYWKR